MWWLIDNKIEDLVILINSGFIVDLDVCFLLLADVEVLDLYVLLHWIGHLTHVNMCVGKQP